MTPSSILHGLAGSPVMDGVQPVLGRCAICARAWPRTAEFDRWQGAGFTDQNKIRAWGSDRICEPCAWAHSWAPPPGFPPQEDGKKGVNLRLFSHLWCERDGYQYANKASKPLIREWLRVRATYRTARCFAAIADTGQKHVVPWTRIALPGSRPLVVRFEEQDVRIGDWSLIDDITALLTDGVTKDELQGADYRLMSWQQSGGLIEPFEARHGHARGSGWWSLALWLSQRDETEHERRSNDRREARAVAKADRGARARSKSRVPGGGRKPAETLGADQGQDARSRPDIGRCERVGDGAVPSPVSARTRQASLFGDD